MDRTRITSPRKVEAVKGIRRVYRNKQKVSIHSTARRLRVSRYFVGRILRKVLRKKPYTENVQFSCNNAGWCHTTHSFITMREFLKQTFGSRVIGKHFTKEWPAQSPDLTPAYYYLWPQLKISCIMVQILIEVLAP